MQNQKVIEQLGYTPNEAKVYLASLSLGEAHVSDIADKVKMPRSTVQAIVDRLYADGLMNFYIMRRYKYWIAEKPEQLLENLRKREEVVTEALPKLAAIRQASKKKNKRDKNYEKSVAIFKDFSETSHLPILVASSDAEIEYVNSTWQKEYGYKLNEVKGENPQIFQSSHTTNAEYERMWKTLNADRLFQSEQVIDKRKDGTIIRLGTTLFPVYHGNRKFYIQILNDITERKHAETLRENFDEVTKED